MRCLNVGVGTHYAEGWVNVDAMRNDWTHPDVLCLDLPFRGGAFDRIYLGHVLEHVPWPAVPAFLAGVIRVLAPDGEILATGPDARRTMRLWKQGALPDDLMWSVLEHADEASDDWPEAVHHWNCHEERMTTALQRAGLDAAPFEPYTSNPNLAPGFDGWPVVNWSGWQCAVLARVKVSAT